MKRLVLIALWLGSTLAAAGSAPPVTLQNTEHRTLRSEKIGQTYDLFVSLPDGYAASGQAYPVLYVLDGWHFPLMAFFQNNNLYSGQAMGSGCPFPIKIEILTENPSAWFSGRDERDDFKAAMHGEESKRGFKRQIFLWELGNLTPSDCRIKRLFWEVSS